MLSLIAKRETALNKVRSSTQGDDYADDDAFDKAIAKKEKEVNSLFRAGKKRLLNTEEHATTAHQQAIDAHGLLSKE